MQESKEAIKRAEAKNFAGGGSIPSVSTVPEPTPIQETTQQKVARQRKNRIEETEKGWEKIQAAMFDLAWMQSPKTQSQSALWKALFTDDTSKEKQQLIKKANTHLNEPVREGEIVVIPTAEPRNTKEKEALSTLQEEAAIGSLELGKLSDDSLSLVNRHLELLDYFADDALCTIDESESGKYYDYASIGVGIAAGFVQKHLENIQGILSELNELYVDDLAKNGKPSATFFAQRASLFKKLDDSFARLSKRSVKLPLYTQVRRNLKLSTKSVIHHADEIISKGYVSNLGKRIANISIGVDASRAGGYVGLMLGGASVADSIYEACNVDSYGECGRTTTRKTVGFISSIPAGTVGGQLAAAGTVLLLGAVGIASAPVIAVAAPAAFIVGGFTGGHYGGQAGEFAGDKLYQVYEYIME
ncbi:hypothetical protein HLG76_06300 [Salinivibrio sp. EAGSL]|uniref:hypothetical protein n=1 Tax=Salinivibrio sp. EAGSL TaxID=2738468 RepID=UPI00158EDBF0|nr:hypothetical protein [Salinivibrio sp. EAGSL]NUY56181.1 hypothetical protein [Salinivibrio sp. EAGSL]